MLKLRMKSLMMKNKVQKAILFAVKKHRHQLRKGTNLPYVVHPLSVMKQLIDMGAEEDIIIAGILHDTLEDTDISYRELKRKFGVRVADIVKGCSENKNLPWKARKQETIDKMNNPDNEDVFLVELADKYCNLRDIYLEHEEKGFWKRFKASKKSLKWYYLGINNAIKRHYIKTGKYLNITSMFDMMYEKVFG